MSSNSASICHTFGHLLVEYLFGKQTRAYTRFKHTLSLSHTQRYLSQTSAVWPGAIARKISTVLPMPEGKRVGRRQTPTPLDITHMCKEEEEETTDT